MSNRRQFFLALAGAAGLGISAQAAGTNLQPVRREGVAFASPVSILVLHDDPDAAACAIDAAMPELDVIERVMSLYRPDSEIRRLNRDGALEHPHPYMVEVLRAAQAMSQRSDGAFDVTVQPLWTLYKEASRAGRRPAADALEAARRLVDWRQVQVTDDRIAFRRKGMAITLNALAQGFAADRVMAALRAHGIAHALVNTGEIGALGDKGGEPWVLGIQDPRRLDEFAARAQLVDRGMATSGDYATTFTKDRLYHHIFDPQTGRSPEAFASVTVTAPTATEADALATAAFVAGPEKGLALVRSTPAAEGFFIFKDGRMLATEGFPFAPE
jgi:thiamine biosynthesis lipoprotein